MKTDDMNDDKKQQQRKTISICIKVNFLSLLNKAKQILFQ